MSYPLSQSLAFLHRATADRQNPFNDAPAVVEGDKVHVLVTCVCVFPFHALLYTFLQFGRMHYISFTARVTESSAE